MYTRTPTIKSQLINYKNIAEEETKLGKSRCCWKCALCGNYGIYAAKNVHCNENYIRQTVTLQVSRKRWSKHRGAWNTSVANYSTGKHHDESNKYNLDKNALFKHFALEHPEKIIQDLEISETFTLAFVDQSVKKKRPRLKQINV